MRFMFPGLNSHPNGQAPDIVSTKNNLSIFLSIKYKYNKTEKQCIM